MGSWKASNGLGERFVLFGNIEISSKTLVRDVLGNGSDLSIRYLIENLGYCNAAIVTNLVKKDISDNILSDLLVTHIESIIFIGYDPIEDELELYSIDTTTCLPDILSEYPYPNLSSLLDDIYKKYKTVNIFLQECTTLNHSAGKHAISPNISMDTILLPGYLFIFDFVSYLSECGFVPDFYNRLIVDKYLLAVEDQESYSMRIQTDKYWITIKQYQNDNEWEIRSKRKEDSTFYISEMEKGYNNEAISLLTSSLKS